MNKKTEKFSFKSLIPMVLALLLIGLFIVPIPYYIEGPGTTENLKEFVTVDGKKDTQSGAFYLTTVGIRSATIFSAIKANFSDFQEVMSKKELMGDSSNSEYNRIQQYYMDSSKNAAIEQALKLAKVPYEMKFKGVYVLAMEDNSSFKGKIEVGDTVTGVDGKSFKSSEELMNYIKAQKVNQKVTVQFTQDGKAKEATGKLIELPTDKKAGIGIGLTDHTEIDSSIPVSIEAGDIGGPSAGLMFTLQTYELSYRLAELLLVAANHEDVYKKKHTEIAEYLGVSYRHLIYTFKQFRERGFIQKQGTAYHINRLALHSFVQKMKS